MDLDAILTKALEKDPARRYMGLAPLYRAGYENLRNGYGPDTHATREAHDQLERVERVLH